MSLGVRGFNPIWSEVDLQGNLFDDTFYLFVLENTIPYIPATVWHDPDLNTAWTNPIQFLANGTLPNDIFFETDTVYRLEFRQGPDQSYPLIYEVNDYVAGEGGNVPVDASFSSENQVTNPQFSLINFESPLVISATDPDPIEIAPGWFFEAAGTGTVTFTQVPLTSTNTNPSNAPYALELTVAGWDEGSVFLRQRFEQNGMLWANKTVSSAITARIQGAPQAISAALVSSDGPTPLGTVLSVPVVNEAFNEYTGHATLGATTNTDTPPAAYIDYKLALPSTVDIYVTSIQLVVQDKLDLSEPSFVQDSIDRQIDHTFHYYKPQLAFKPIPSMLVGWDFPLNPAQELGTAVTLNTTAKYIWDQTIGKSVVGNIAVIRNTITGGLQATTANASEAFYILQYLDGAQAREILGNKLSVNINAFRTQAGGIVTCKVYLYSARAAATFPSIPTTIGTIAASGVFTLTAANWSLIPRDTLGQASSILPTVSTADNTQLNDAEDLKFSGWEITDTTQIGDTNKFAIVVTFACPTTGSVVNIDSIALMKGDIATRPGAQTADEVLRECEYYWEKSYDQSVVAGTITAVGALTSVMVPNPVTGAAGNITNFATDFGFPFKVPKRVTGATVTLYSANSATPGFVESRISNQGVHVATANVAIGNWTAPLVGEKSIVYPLNFAAIALFDTSPTAIIGGTAVIRYQYTVNARLGEI